MVLQDFILVKISAAHFAEQNTKFGGGGSGGEAGIHFPHTPFSARLARANWFWARGARHQFRSKWVRAKFRIEHQIILSRFLREVASPLRGSAWRLCALRKAIKSHGAENEKEAVGISKINNL